MRKQRRRQDLGSGAPQRYAESPLGVCQEAAARRRMSLGGIFGPGQQGVFRLWVLFLFLGLVLVLGRVGSTALAQDSAEEQFAATSLRYRTALHYDPLLDAPLDALVKLYVGAGRAEELIALYRNHISQYPDDAGAKAVLVRILRRIDRAGADELIASVVPRHPDYAPLQYILFRFLEERGDPRATEALSRAIDLETQPARRNEWLEELLRLSEGEAARALARTHLERLINAPDLTPSQALSLGRLAQRHRFWDLSIKALEIVRMSQPEPEVGIEVEAMIATAMGQQGKRKEAAVVLDRLLKRLGPDHWRRRELLGMRFSVLSTEEERAALLKNLETAWKANPQSESAVLDYAEALLSAERGKEAVRVLIEASTMLPQSTLIENRTLELLEASPDRETYVGYLTTRLESAPDRADLRFRLVKVQYALGRDAEAEQDFLAVVAGLPPEEVSVRILELQRYLRGIDRIDAAVSYLERYLRDHPSRLDVARELAEIRLANGAEERVGELIGWLQPGEAEVENVLDFSDFLLEEGFVQAARRLVEAKLATEPQHFALRLALIEILGRDGDANAARQQIAETREMAGSTQRYRQWINAAVNAHRHLETLPGFIESELNRYQFDDDWSEEKLEKFIILCEAGRHHAHSPRIAEILRKQLAQPNLKPDLKQRLRRVLVAVLEADTTAAPEVEEQLKSLALEDASHRDDYDLRRALVYHRNKRDDLARQLLATIDPIKVSSAPLLREASDVLIQFGLLQEAATALEAVVRLEPEDILSRERRLSVLAALGEESILRAAIRGLRDVGSGVALRERSRRALDRHLDASYWRSIAARLESGRLDEALPLLASVEQEATSERSRLWTDWTRSRILTRLGREAEAREALDRFLGRARAAQLERIVFPDGLELSVEAAAKSGETLSAEVSRPESEDRPGFLLAKPAFRWAFEVPEGRRVLRMGTTGDRALVLDDLDWVYGLDAVSGKLLWRRYHGDGNTRASASRPASFDAVAGPPALLHRSDSSVADAKLARAFAVSGTRYFLIRDGACVAHSVEDGSILWSAPLPERPSASLRREGALPDVVFDLAEGRVVLFDPILGSLLGLEEESGKLLWEASILPAPEGEETVIFSLNTGLQLSSDLGLAYGGETVLFDPANGEVIWRFRENGVEPFPIVLRPPREGEEEGGEPADDAKRIPERAPRFDFQAQKGAGRLDPERFLEAEAALLGPAVYWSESRLRQSEPAAAVLADGAIWLLQKDKVRRLSSDLPVASYELPAGGALVGRAGDHLWFLKGSVLHHVDFRHQRRTVLNLVDLGGGEELRATMTGSLLLLRNHRGFILINALTGEVMGRAPLPQNLVDYLATALPAVANGEHSPPQEVWQGRLQPRGPGQAALCLPVGDLLAEKRYLSLFGERIVVCLEAASEVVNPSAPTPQ